MVTSGLPERAALETAAAAAGHSFSITQFVDEPTFYLAVLTFTGNRFRPRHHHPAEQLAALYDSIFDQFDLDGSGTVDFAEFRSEMKKILLAVADGLGASPIQIAFEADPDGGRSFLRQAADLEATKLAGDNRG
ncbi:hypothetical protein KSP40_PGU002960 [Platanthera guangdongensis]|uniref:EF-hand domain-containing protein n=1 Tax=Platanthera guangdongensis TaxID=2320717 RepID=A0ABR2M344_9ASPA